jgi:DNA-binding NarL/FixJ family response regulator
MINVLVVDDQKLVRAGLRVILDAEPDVTVLGEASDGVEALRENRDLQPDVVLMDIRMPNMDGLEAARRIITGSQARVLILTTFDADEYVYGALQAGASGFLLKDAPPEQLVAAVRAAAAGNALIDPSVTKRLIAEFTRAVRPSSAATPAELDSLTGRELEVLRLLTEGLSNNEIAERLVVEESTVKTHVSRILMKLGLRDRVQAVILAYRTGLVQTD